MLSAGHERSIDQSIGRLTLMNVDTKWPAETDFDECMEQNGLRRLTLTNVWGKMALAAGIDECMAFWGTHPGGVAGP